MTATLVFDFDGTVAVGNGAVLAYARAAARRLGADYLALVERTIAAFDEGAEPRFRDGYDVVGTLAAESGLDPIGVQEAYLASRAALGAPDATVDMAPGLPELLEQLPASTRVVLATNAPALGVEALLERWGVREHFDELRYDSGKPAGLDPIVREALARGPVLSIGDIVENDLAPAAALGADTALVGATAAGSAAEVTMRAATLAELSPQILAWARRADAQTPVLPGTGHPLER
ncbi:HAD family hydrolase [Microbacterium sp. Marseille-Q6965]|uniref:HAD family hydrolase n=1 Tax=Microbacterium sp. Marseille-Q6965 TaxID=2965072 RepID=UPI0021B84DB9|nr:HAD family hydrolase [Microbacterium sp. Marseille-Q6965]